MATVNALRKVKIINLPWTIGDLQLKQYFSQFGNIINARVYFDRSTGLSKGTGFIEVTDRKTYEDILKKTHHLEGFDVYVKSWNDN